MSKNWLYYRLLTYLFQVKTEDEQFMLHSVTIKLCRETKAKQNQVIQFVILNVNQQQQ